MKTVLFTSQKFIYYYACEANNNRHLQENHFYLI